MEIKILELFGGIGACTKAFKRLGIPHKVVDYVEIDKYAVKSYNAINGVNFEPQDITTWDKDIEVDLIMHGSPCQSISSAGLQHGADKGSGTRSSLMWETVRIVDKLKPKYVIWENVRNLLSKKHIHNFNAYLETMEQLGYTNYFKVLNAKDFVIPQNRERVFTISIRKDISQIFTFPQPQELKLRLKDMLEEKVDEKYYLSDEKIQKIANWKAYQKPFEKVQGKNSIVPTLTARGAGEEHSGMITYCNDLEDTTNLQPIIIGSTQEHAAISTDGIVPTLTSAMGRGGGHVPMHNYDLQIRKLTPKECWRLMGFDDEDCDKASKVNSNTQLYKQAGNSIVVNVLEAILTNLLLKTNQEISKGQMTIFDYEGNI